MADHLDSHVPTDKCYFVNRISGLLLQQALLLKNQLVLYYTL